MNSQFKPIEESTNKLETVLEQLRKKNLSVMKINALTRIGREELLTITNGIFQEFQLNPEYLYNIFSAIVEVIFNGLKANYKFLTFKDEIKERLTNLPFSGDTEELLRIIFEIDTLREFLNRYVVPDKMKKRVHYLMKTDEKKRLGADDLTEEDHKTIELVRATFEREKMHVHFTIAVAPAQIAFSVVNNSPILKKDAVRIERSRNAHAALAANGESARYFSPEYIDTTESAGMGIAMADEVYYDLGLNPLEWFTLQTNSRNTSAILRFPRYKIAL